MLSGDLRPSRGAVRLRQRDDPQLSAARTGAAPRDAVAARQCQLSRSRSRKSSGWAPATAAAPPRSRWSTPPCTRSASTDFRDRKLPTLSGGEQQRAHFARVLVQLGCGEAEHGPGLLLLDEPTSSLDLRHQIDLAETARRCARNGTTVIAILHDLNLAVRFADRIDRAAPRRASPPTDRPTAFSPMR